MSIYLREEMITKDLSKFAKDMQEREKFDKVTVFKEEAVTTNGFVFMGYEIKNKEDVFVVTMIYIKNSIGELCLGRNNGWKIVKNGRNQIGYFPSLKEVFDLIKNGRISNWYSLD